MKWPPSFSPLKRPNEKPGLEIELRRELKPGHPLYGLSVEAIGRRYDQDDVLFELLDDSGRVAEVHLTWAGESEKPPYPCTALFDSFAAWSESVKEDHA